MLKNEPHLDTFHEITLMVRIYQNYLIKIFLSFAFSVSILFFHLIKLEIIKSKSLLNIFMEVKSKYRISLCLFEMI